jgi:hypothetical protein
MTMAARRSTSSSVPSPGTRIEMQPAFDSREDMEKVVNMGTLEA